MEKEKLFNVIGLRARFPLSLFRKIYLYADRLEPQFPRVLRRSAVRSFRPRGAYRFPPGRSYGLFCCDVFRWEEQALLEALDELEKDLLIMGCRDYRAYCDEAFEQLTQA